MNPEIRPYLNDILDAANLLNEFTHGKDLAEFLGSPLLRSATERQFAIIGEAVSKLANLDADVASRITEYRQIIAFRNFLIHQYRSVDNSAVWDILQRKLPVLVLDVEALVREE